MFYLFKKKSMFEDIWAGDETERNRMERDDERELLLRGVNLKLERYPLGKYSYLVKADFFIGLLK